MLGADVATTTLVAEETIPPARHGSDRARAAATETTVARAKDALLAAAARAFAQPSLRQSPIAEGVTKVAATGAGDLRRTIVVVTDARVVTQYLDEECGHIGNDEQAIAALTRTGALRADQLADIDVEFAHVEGRPIVGRSCTVTVAREQRIKEVWTAALSGAGASHVRMSAGAAALTNIDDTDLIAGKD